MTGPMSRAFTTGIILALVLVGADARATEHLELADGQVVDGKVLSAEVDGDVIIQVDDGSSQTVSWTSVERIVLGEDSPIDLVDDKVLRSPPQDVAPEAVPNDQPKGTVPAHVRPARIAGYRPRSPPTAGEAASEIAVHLRADRAVELVREQDGEETVVCRAPCGGRYEVRSDARLFVDGSGMPRSSSVDVPADGGALSLDVHSGDSSLWVTGIVAASVGFVGASAAGIYTAVEHQGLTYWPPEPEPFAAGIGAAAGLLIGTAGTLIAIFSDTDVALQTQGGGYDSSRPGTWRF
jgi:hypothetical protein